MNDLEIHEGGLEHRTDDIAEIPTHYWIRTEATDSVGSWDIVKASMDNIHIINDPTRFGCYEVVAIPNHPQTHHQQLQKAREEERERITNKLEELLLELDSMDALGIATPEHLGERVGIGKAKAVTRNHSELDQDNK